MSVGKRTGPLTYAAPTPTSRGGAARRGGYPLGLLTVAIASFIGLDVLLFIPAVNPVGMGALEPLMALAPIVILTVAVVAAVVMATIDGLLRLMKLRHPWLYATLCGLGLFAVMYGLSSIDARPHLPLLIGVALIPGAAGGWVMGLFRR